MNEGVARIRESGDADAPDVAREVVGELHIKRGAALGDLQQTARRIGRHADHRAADFAMVEPEQAVVDAEAAHNEA